MENIQGKEGIYASLDQFNKGRIIVHDLGLTLLLGSQIQTEGEHEVEIVNPSEQSVAGGEEQNVASGEEQGSDAVPDASRIAGEAQRNLSLAPGRDVQRGDPVRSNVGGYAVPVRHTLKRKSCDGRTGAAETAYSSQDDCGDLGDDENEERDANWTPKKALPPQKKQRLTSDGYSSVGDGGFGDRRVLLRIESRLRDESFFRGLSMLCVAAGTLSSANRNGRKSSGPTPAPQPPELLLALSRQSTSARFYVSDSSTDSKSSTLTSDPGLKVYTGRQQAAVAQKALFLPKSQPRAYFEPGESLSRSPIVENRENYGHQVDSATAGSERRYRSCRSTPAPAKALNPVAATSYSISAASRLQHSSYSNARGLNFSSNPGLGQSRNRGRKLTNPVRETSSVSQSQKHTQVSVEAKHRSALRPPSSAVHLHRSESNGTAKLYPLRRRAYSASDIPRTKEACRAALSLSSSKASAFTTFSNSNSSSFRPRARSTSSAMSFNYNYSSGIQGSTNPNAATDSTLDANLNPMGSAYQWTPLPPIANTNTPLNTGFYLDSGTGYSNAGPSGIGSLYHDSFHDTFDNSTRTDLSNEGLNRPSRTSSAIGNQHLTGQTEIPHTGSTWSQTYNQNAFDNTTLTELPSEGLYRPSQTSSAISSRHFTGQTEIPGTGSTWSQTYNQNALDNTTSTELPSEGLYRPSWIPPAIGNQRIVARTEIPGPVSTWSKTYNQNAIADNSTYAEFPSNQFSFSSQTSPAFGNQRFSAQTEIPVTDSTWLQPYNQNAIADNSTYAEFPNNQFPLSSLDSPTIGNQRFTAQTEIPIANSMWSQSHSQNVTKQPVASMDAAYRFVKSTAQPPYASGMQLSRSSSSGYESLSFPQTPFTPGFASHYSQDERSGQPLKLDRTSTPYKQMGAQASLSRFVPYSHNATPIITDSSDHQMSPPSQIPRVLMTTHKGAKRTIQLDAAIQEICGDIMSRQSNNEDIWESVLSYVRSFPLPGEKPQPAETLSAQESSAKVEGLRKYADSYRLKANNLTKKNKEWLAEDPITGKTRGQEVKEELQRLKREAAKKDLEILHQSQQIDQWRQKYEKLDELFKTRPLPAPKPAAAVIGDQERRTGWLGSEILMPGNPQVAIDLIGENTTPAPAVTNKRKTGDWLTGYRPLSKHPRLSVHGEPTPHEQHLLGGPQLGHNQAAANAAPSATLNPGSGGGQSEAEKKEKEAIGAARRAKYHAINAEMAAAKAEEERRKAKVEAEEVAEETAESQEGVDRGRMERGAFGERFLEGGEGEADVERESDGEGSVEDLLAAELDAAYARVLEADAATADEMGAEMEADVDGTTQGPADEGQEGESEEE